MTPLESMRLTASDPEAARRSTEEILFGAFGARMPEREELTVVLSALDAVATSSALDRLVVDAPGLDLQLFLAQEPRP